MNSWAWRITACVSLAALCSPALAQPVPRSAPISGKVVAKRGGETAVLVPSNSVRQVAVRQNLKAGDVIRTNSKGALSIIFADRTQIRLAKNSTLRVKAVKRGSPSAVRLERGRAWGRTPRKGSNLSVETPAATAGIRGTEWSISAEDERTILEVYEGEVELFNDSGSLNIAAGQAASARLGEAPTRIAIVDRYGREQMLYFLRLEDGLDAFAGDGGAGFEAVRQGDWEAARQAFANPTDTPRAAAIASYGRFLADIRLGGDPELPPLDRSEPSSFAIRAYLESYLGDLEKARGTTAQGLGLFPANRELLEARARIALVSGDGDLARQAAEAMLARDPQDAAALAIKADVAINYDGRPYEALDAAEQAIATGSEDPRVLSTASEIQLERGAAREALRSIDRAIELDPNNGVYHAQRAAVLLGLGQVKQAKPSIDRALELDPSLSIVRSTLSDYYLLRGENAQALDEALAASAENPAYGGALLQLAQVNYQLGEVEPAIQQLDAADRLDPASPFTPLARTAIALHRFDADGAIAGAGEALTRYRARGGDYANLSENRATGSLVSQAFRFLGMEGWGRYYADRVFDTFTPSSYFDQALNQTPGPFVIRDANGSFDTTNAEDLDQLSSFLQGIALDPLSVANPERQLTFDNSVFVEPELRISLLEEDLRSRRSVSGEFDAIFNGPLPVGIGITADFTDENDAFRRPEFGIFGRSDGGKSFDIEAFVGIEAGAFDRLAFSAVYADTQERGATSSFTADGQEIAEPRELINEESRFVFGLWGHDFGQRSRSTLAFGTGTIGSVNEVYNVNPTIALTDFVDFETVDFSFASASYARGIGPLDVTIGAEFADLASTDIGFPFDVDDPATLDTSDITNRELALDEFRLFADLRLKPTDWLILQGQVQRVTTSIDAQVQGGLSQISDNRNLFNWRAAAAIEPVPGQWFRFASEQTSEGLFSFTFAPVNSIGLKGNIAPRDAFSQTRSQIVRWDAQWSDRFFTSVEYQDQRHDALGYEIPDSSVPIGGGPVDLNRLRVEANFWPGANIGLRASYALTDSSIRGAFSSGTGAPLALAQGFGCSTPGGSLMTACTYEIGQQLPFVPRHIAQASAVWVLPAPIRLRTTLNVNHIGGQIDDISQPLADATTADLRLEWEPWDRRLTFELAALNLFDVSYESATNVPAPRLTIIASAGMRF